MRSKNFKLPGKDFGTCSMNLRLSLLTSLLILFTSLLPAQTPQLDSLITVLKTLPDDTSKVNALQKTIKEYLKSIRDYKKIEELSWRQLALSKKIAYEKGMAYAYSNIGICYRYKGNNELAFYFYKKALPLMIKLRDKRGEANVYNNMGVWMLGQGNYAASINNHLKALKIREELCDTTGMSSSYLNIGNVFSEQEKVAEALKYYMSAAKLSEKWHDLNIVGDAYNNIGNVYKAKKDYKQALTYALKALKIREKGNDRFGMAFSYTNIGGIYFDEKQPEMSLLYQLQAYDLAVQNGDKTTQAYACNGIGNVKETQKNYQEALYYFKKTLKLATALDNKKLILLAYEGLASVYQKTGDFKQALSYTNVFNSVKDSIHNLKSKKQIVELNTIYETEKREKEILLLTKEKELSIQVVKQQGFLRGVLIAGVAMLLLLIIGIYRRYLFKQKANLELTKTQDELYKQIEQKEKLTSILAHDLKTPLRFMSTVSTYFNKNLNTLTTEKLEALSAELNTSAKSTFAFADELLTWLSLQRLDFKVLNAEVELQRLIEELIEFFQNIAGAQHTTIRKGSVFTLPIETDKRLLKIILRNILDNAIKNTTNGEIIISTQQLDEDTVALLIHDTGSGMNKEQLEQLNLENTYGFQFEIKNKLGFQIIKDLSTMLHINLNIKSEVGVGTTVIMEIPIKTGTSDMIVHPSNTVIHLF
jgi:signal transduction histidine kinase